MITTQQLDQGVRVHAIQTGTVAVKEEHFQYSGGGWLRVPKILLQPTFVAPMPIWTWVIETPTGNYLIDTGEIIDFYNPKHIPDRVDNVINRTILRIQIAKEQELATQLKAIGLSADKIDVVILTHMHLDHVDGIKQFPKAQFLVSKVDWEKPYGAPLSVFPRWFKPQLIEYQKLDNGFGGSFPLTKGLEVIPTPGHTLGHQSVLLQIYPYELLFAGDITFNETQLKGGRVGGINMQIGESRATLAKVQHYSRQSHLIYLPSHDAEAGLRLSQLIPTRC